MRPIAINHRACQAVALHEAGHFVVASVLSIPVAFVLVRPTASGTIRADCPDGFDTIVFAVAGVAAERRASGSPSPKLLSMGRPPPRLTVDYALAIKHARGRLDLVAEAEVVANQIVAEHWPRAKTVASLLLGQLGRSVSGDELSRERSKQPVAVPTAPQSQANLLKHLPQFFRRIDGTSAISRLFSHVFARSCRVGPIAVNSGIVEGSLRQ